MGTNTFKKADARNNTLNESPFENEFKEITNVYDLLKSKDRLTDVEGQLIKIRAEIDRILTCFRAISNYRPSYIAMYMEYQRKIGLPLYRAIIQMCLEVADIKRRSVKEYYGIPLFRSIKKVFLDLVLIKKKSIMEIQRFAIIEALMEGLDIVITEMDIIDPPAYLQDEGHQIF